MNITENNSHGSTYLALSGGVGGAKLALGLYHLLKENLFIAANTADDFRFFDMAICPDLDTIMYTLADLNDKERGWGLANESWNFLEAMQSLGQESWFQIGDKDLATHITRTKLLGDGKTLSETSRQLCKQLGIEASIFPMTDQLVSTQILLDNDSWLPFQHYFVKEQCKPVIKAFKFEGIESARPSPAFTSCLENPSLKAIFICPSNPFVSIDPILSIPRLRKKLKNHPAPVIAVSPIVGDQAIKGPTAKMMGELNISVSALSIAEHYYDLLDGFILDNQDQHLKDNFLDNGVKIHCTNTIMNTLDDRINLAAECLKFSEEISFTREVREAKEVY